MQRDPQVPFSVQVKLEAITFARFQHPEGSIPSKSLKIKKNIMYYSHYVTVEYFDVVVILLESFIFSKNILIVHCYQVNFDIMKLI